MTTVLSADWVLPVEGAPIADGAVALEDGRIAAVGTAAELGAGRRYEARYAWRAALIYAEGKAVDRLKGKIDIGLRPELAAP